jgi:hypothetical protein
MPFARYSQPMLGGCILLLLVLFGIHLQHALIGIMDFGHILLGYTVIV